MIRIPEIGQAGSPQINAPTVRAGAAMAPTAALGSIVAALGGVGDHFQHLADDERKLINAQMESEARNQLATDFTNFQIEMEKEQDPAKRIEMGRAFFAQSKGIAEKEGLAPIVRDSLRLHVDDFATRGMNHVVKSAAALQEQKTRQAVQNEINMGRDAGDRNGVAGAVARGVANGVMTPEKGEAIMADVDQDIELNTIQAGVDEEPLGVLMDLDKEDFHERFPNVPVAMVPKIRKAAEASIQRKRAEQLDLMQEALDAGKLKPADVEAAEYLEPGDIKKVKSALVESRPEDPEARNKAWAIYHALSKDFESDAVPFDEYVKIHSDARAEIMGLVPAKTRGEFNQGLAARSPAYKSEGNPKPTPKSPALKTTEQLDVARGIIQRNLAGGVFGNTGKDAPLRESEKANRLAEDLTYEVKAYLDENPTKTREEIRQYVDELISGRTSTTAAKTITLPGAGSTMLPLPGMGGAGMGTGAGVLPPKPLSITATQFIDE